MKRKMVSPSIVPRDPLTARHNDVSFLAAANAAASAAAAGLNSPQPQFTSLLGHGGAAISLPLRTARPQDLGWIEAAAAAARVGDHGRIEAAAIAARPSSAGSRRLRETADSSSLAIRPSSAGSRRLRETADSSSAATRPSSAAGLCHTAAAPSGSGPPTGVPSPDLRTMVGELEKGLSQMRHDLSVTKDKADRKLESVATLHESWKARELTLKKKLDISNAKIAELEGVIKLMQAEDSSILDRSKGKLVAMDREHETVLQTELNWLFQTLEVMISAIEHAWKCHVRPCAQRYCSDFKVLIFHVSKCRPQSKETDCAICKQVLSLLSLHARDCTDKACTLLFCQDKGQVRKHSSVEGLSGCKNQ